MEAAKVIADTRWPVAHHLLRLGVKWLYATVQPEAALVEHRGVRFGYGLDTRGIRFLPVAAGGNPLVVLDVEVRPRPRGTGSFGGRSSLDEVRAAPLGEDEAAMLFTRIRSLGLLATQVHNHGLTATINLPRPACRSLRAAVDRWSAGCPHHNGSRVCDAPRSARGQACTWRSAGHQAALWPRDLSAWAERFIMETAYA